MIFYNTTQDQAPLIPTITADCTVVIPTYNEHDNIHTLIDRVLALPRFRVLIVDDNSPDGTADVVAAVAHNEPRVGLLSRPGKLGLGTAYVAGFRRALAEGAQFICEMDADFSHDPAYLPQLLAAAETTYDLALGSRYIEGGGTTDWGKLRKLISRGGNTYARLILGLAVMDATSGFRCYQRRVLEAIDLDAIESNGYAFQIELVYRTMCAGFRIGEIPIIFPDRRVGNSKMSRRIVFEALLKVWKLRIQR
ncbi:MAG: polyprenol monophosphomannose synthase [Chloroflexi bacterium AL-W]|nr:polyprenol monophosphomannose synthase [Chloroflexi bacterium AL-N1]NOK68172.1 polyprenol monophosphomannose synthase [Chloroflexi bacterium AL-N10]NOK73512.1 polyprenol monophosphomannose synthase [Chloroflexi bacterium AL-N5]NOK84054.1 polyprenol monophosphomannose synthase [Chloroflexi bacterium AL-W]NOK87843.1 polyprenol monophosphomannose synthase [Chloroflexi bacterium AL-N15]